MIQYRGLLRRVGAKEGDMIVNSSGHSAVGNVRVSGTVSVIEIGDKMLRNVGCPRDIYDLLEPGEEAVLYVHNHFFHKPVVIGVGYPEQRRTYKLTFGTMFANALSYLIIYPMLILFGGLVSTMFLGNFLGFVLIVAGLGLCIFNAVSLVKGYFAIPAS